MKPREKSTNNNLKDLSVEGYSISPSFDKNTLEYTVNLESNVEKIKINATKEDGYASVSGVGEKDVQEGDNKFAGTGKEYTQTLSVSPSGFISESKKKTLGIQHSEHTEDFVGTDNKKYALFMTATADGPAPTVNYAEEGFEGCEVLPVKIYNMQYCFLENVCLLLLCRQNFSCLKILLLTKN